jgi:hypothetical protein
MSSTGDINEEATNSRILPLSCVNILNGHFSAFGLVPAMDSSLCSCLAAHSMLATGKSSAMDRQFVSEFGASPAR